MQNAIITTIDSLSHEAKEDLVWCIEESAFEADIQRILFTGLRRMGHDTCRERGRIDLHVDGVGVELKAYNSDLFYRIGKDSSDDMLFDIKKDIAKSKGAELFVLFVAMGIYPEANNSKGNKKSKETPEAKRMTIIDNQMHTLRAESVDIELVNGVSLRTYFVKGG